MLYIVMSLSPQVKSVKPCLKQLQQCIQTISTLHDDEILPSNPADLFHWLPKEHMCVLVYLVMPLLFLCHIKVAISVNNTRDVIHLPAVKVANIFEKNYNIHYITLYCI